MDTLREENGCRDCKKVGFQRDNNSSEDSSEDEETTRMIIAKPAISTDKEHYLQPPQIYINSHPGGHDSPARHYDSDRRDSSNMSSRRPSAIIAALRRPSQAVALSAAHAVMNQRRYLLNFFNPHHDQNTDNKEDNKEAKEFTFNARIGNDRLTTILSALYAKLLVVMGLALPMTEVMTTNDVEPFHYQGFYLYLYIGSMAYLIFEYASCIRQKAFQKMIKNYQDTENMEFVPKKAKRHVHSYGSFYLRLGAISFGIGSMVYSGLEFGRYFELRNNRDCNSSALLAITSASRMVLTLLQIQFIFLNHRDLNINQHKIIARFGLMHMIATNVCEWLLVLIEETKHEIVHLKGHAGHNLTENNTSNVSINCEGRIMGSLISDVSPFLFPCTIEYSLICAVILYEIWKHIEPELNHEDDRPSKKKKEKHQNDLDIPTSSSSFHFTIDCSSSHRGLFAGIVVIVLTIISLVMFFVLADSHDQNAEFEVNVVELILYITTTIAVLIAMYQLRSLRYVRKFDEDGVHGIGLDNTLLTVAQTGMFIYCMFSIIGWSFVEAESNVGMLADIFSFIQTCLQTMFVLDGWFRRCRNIEQAQKKPGKELITFLIVANLAMWTINTLEKNRAEFRPTHLMFFGNSAWAIITHVSMPLAIFYRFHSTICLFEIWKSAYKIKSSFKNPLFPVSNL